MQTQQLESILQNINESLSPNWNGIFEIDFKQNLMSINKILLEQLNDTACNGFVNANLTTLLQDTNDYLEYATINFTLPQQGFVIPNITINGSDWSHTTNLLSRYSQDIVRAQENMTFNGTRNKWADFGMRMAILNQVIYTSQNPVESSHAVLIWSISMAAVILLVLGSIFYKRRNNEKELVFDAPIEPRYSDLRGIN